MSWMSYILISVAASSKVRSAASRSLRSSEARRRRWTVGVLTTPKSAGCPDQYRHCEGVEFLLMWELQDRGNDARVGVNPARDRTGTDQRTSTTSPPPGNFRWGGRAGVRGGDAPRPTPGTFHAGGDNMIVGLIGCGLLGFAAGLFGFKIKSRWCPECGAWTQKRPTEQRTPASR